MLSTLGRIGLIKENVFHETGGVHMYLRRTFTVIDREVQLNVIRDAGWGCIFGMKDGVPIASHLPFLVVGE
jgi:hypothetical protein